MTTAFVFPGQGSQSVGMGKALAEQFSVAKDVFAEVDEALNQPLSRIIFEGPADELTMTKNTQPALMAVSIAALRVLEHVSGKSIDQLAQFVAGHSLGEYSALCAASSITLADSAKILRIRGEAMQAAVPAGKGSMAALIGVDQEQAQAIADHVNQTLVCEIANDNGGGQIVLSGQVEAIQQVVDIASDFGARRAVQLPVSAPFHCSMMNPAAEKMQEALAHISVQAPRIPLIANVTAKESNDPEAIKAQLVAQVTGQVRWRESMLALKDKGVDNIVEIGAGKVLAGLAKRIDNSFSATSLQTPEDIEQYLA